MANQSLQVATPTVNLVNGIPQTTSLDIADHFGKLHKNVIQAIDRLECPEDFRRLNFQPSSYLNEQKRDQPMYNITRDGFVILAMGFTGKQAMEWKIKYIQAFNAMETRMKGQPQLPPSSPARSVLPIRIESNRPLFHYPLESQFSDQEKLGFTRAGAMTVILQTTTHLLKKEMNSPLRKLLYQIVQENMGDVRGCIEELDCLYFQLRSIHTHVESLRNLSNEMQNKVERLLNEGRTIVVKKG
ncbi:MAG TPA: Rha family transcriptional regulator [Acidobacteriota bacterium]|nr:Rha family transcriptional regulator [Acidobacteriota bacterium]